MYEAERYYDGGSTGFCNECHEPETWSELNTEEYEVYEGDNTEDHIDAWTVNNPGVSNSEVYTPSGADQEQVFMGGFNPECPDGTQWQYDDTDNEWRCDGALDMTQTVLQPTITSGSTIGIAVMPYFTQESTDDYQVEGSEEFNSYTVASAFNDNVPDGDTLETMHARCWLGTLSDDPEDLDPSKVIQEEVSLDTDMETPFGIYGEVDREEGENSYACQWEYETSEDISPIAETGQMTQNTVLQNKGTLEIMASDSHEDFKDEYLMEDEDEDIDDLEFTSEKWEEQAKEWEDAMVLAE